MTRGKSIVDDPRISQEASEPPPPSTHHPPPPTNNRPTHQTITTQQQQCSGIHLEQRASRHTPITEQPPPTTRPQTYAPQQYSSIAAVRTDQLTRAASSVGAVRTTTVHLVRVELCRYFRFLTTLRIPGESTTRSRLFSRSPFAGLRTVACCATGDTEG